MMKFVSSLFVCFFTVKISLVSSEVKHDLPTDRHFLAMVHKIKKLVDCGFYPKQVMDVGASKGEWTKSILSIYPNSKFLMVEANNFFEPLLKEIDQTYEIAMISDKISPNAEFYIGNGDSAGSSMHRENSHHPFHKIIRPSHTIDELAQKHAWTPEILKIDIQGSEFQALRGAAKVLKTATIVFIEAPIHNFNQGAASFRQISALLARAGFELYDMFGFNHVNYYMIQFDAVYVKRSSSLWSKTCTGFPVPFRQTPNSKTTTSSATTAFTTYAQKVKDENLSKLIDTLPSRVYEADFWDFNRLGCGYQSSVIMDVGAATGKWTKQAIKQFPNAKVLLIEGNSVFESALKSMNMPYEMTLVSDKESTKVKFYIPSEDNSLNIAGSSMLTQNSMIAYKEVIQASTTLDNLAKKHNIYPDFIKLDVQGAEMLVLKGSTEVLKSASIITVEIQIHNLHQGAPTFRQIANLLWKAGFELYDVYSFTYIENYIVQFDAIFVRITSSLWHLNCTGFPIPAHFKLDVSGKMNQLKDKIKAPFST